MIDYSKSLQILKSRLRPVVVLGTEHLDPYSDLGPDYSSYIFCRASGPISTSHQLILVIYIV